MKVGAYLMKPTLITLFFSIVFVRHFFIMKGVLKQTKISWKKQSELENG